MSKDKTPKLEKLEALNRFLSDEYVLVHVNSLAEDVNLPTHLMNQSSVTLKLSRHFRGSLEVTEEKVTAELLFGESYFSCLIPLAAIWGVTGVKGNNVIWPESTPKDVLKQLLQPVTAAEEPEKPAAAEKKSEEKKQTNPFHKKGGHLKRVK